MAASSPTPTTVTFVGDGLDIGGTFAFVVVVVLYADIDAGRVQTAVRLLAPSLTTTSVDVPTWGQAAPTYAWATVFVRWLTPTPSSAEQATLAVALQAFSSPQAWRAAAAALANLPVAVMVTPFAKDHATEVRIEPVAGATMQLRFVADGEIDGVAVSAEAADVVVRYSSSAQQIRDELARWAGVPSPPSTLGFHLTREAPSATVQLFGSVFEVPIDIGAVFTLPDGALTHPMVIVAPTLPAVSVAPAIVPCTALVDPSWLAQKGAGPSVDVVIVTLTFPGVLVLPAIALSLINTGHVLRSVNAAIDQAFSIDWVAWYYYDDGTSAGIGGNVGATDNLVRIVLPPSTTTPPDPRVWSPFSPAPPPSGAAFLATFS